jgi:purine-nucleoside phosphorylase
MPGLRPGIPDLSPGGHSLATVPTTTPGSSGTNPFEQARAAARELHRLTGVAGFDVVVVLGTGLSPVAGLLGAAGRPVDLEHLPWFTRFTGPGHRPEAWPISWAGHSVLVVAGRLHLYEGRTPAEVVHLVRTAVAAGVHTVILTCSAGAINPAYRVGQVVAISDHLNLSGHSPLAGLPAHLDRAELPAPGLAADGGPGVSRHLDQTGIWSPALRALVHAATADVPEGVYAQMPGPELETPAEIRMLRGFGADLVGMSTVPEAIAARHLGAHVLGLSVVTNAAAGEPSADLGVPGIVAAAAAASGRVAQLIGGVLQALPAPGTG